MLGDREISNCTYGNLPDPISGTLLDVSQLAVLGHFAAAEQCPAGMVQRSLRGNRIVVVTPAGLPAPSECRGDLPRGRYFIGPERTRRPARLIDAGLELFGMLE